MRRGAWHIRQVLAVAALVCLAACTAGCTPGSENTRETRSGEWRGQTAFGLFSFTVCEGGGKITDYALQYTAGGATQALALGGGDEVLIDKEGAFDLSTPEAGVVFRGVFSEDGKRVSGVWEITVPDGDTLREEWTIER